MSSQNNKSISKTKVTTGVKSTRRSKALDISLVDAYSLYDAADVQGINLQDEREVLAEVLNARFIGSSQGYLD